MQKLFKFYNEINKVWRSVPESATANYLMLPIYLQATEVHRSSPTYWSLHLRVLIDKQLPRLLQLLIHHP